MFEHISGSTVLPKSLSMHVMHIAVGKEFFSPHVCKHVRSCRSATSHDQERTIRQLGASVLLGAIVARDSVD